MPVQEGIIKFKQRFQKAEAIPFKNVKELNYWRNIFYELRLIGQNPQKYNGAGYGNVSKRLEKGFLITGSQTGGLKMLTSQHYATVLECHPVENAVITQGPIEASSESMTHGAIYDADETAKYIFHVHSSHIWKHAKKLNMPITKETVSYGTPEMVQEIQRLFSETDVKTKKILSMGGHEDGIISFGSNQTEAGLVMLQHYFLSLSFSKSRQ